MSNTKSGDFIAPLESYSTPKASSPNISKRNSSPKPRSRSSSTGSNNKKRNSTSFGKQDALEALKELEDAPPLDSTRSSTEAVWREKSGKIVIVRAQVPFLIQTLLQDNSDQTFLEYFLLSFEYFLDVVDFLKMLIDLYKNPPAPVGTNNDELDTLGNTIVVQLRIVNVLKKLGDLKYHVYRSNEAWLNIFASFVQSLENGNEIERSCANRLKNFAANSLEVAPIVMPYPTFKPELGVEFDFFKSEPRVIAEQLCLLDLKLLKSISIEELHHKRFEEKKSSGSSSKSNIGKTIDNFNQTSFWLASFFFSSENPKDRLQILCKYIQIMDHLLQCHNYNSLMKFFSALNMAPISALQNYWTELPPEFNLIWERIQQVMSHSHNYKSYRELLERAKPPCIPYLGLILRDLIYIEEMEDKIGDMVNWEKMHLLGKTFSMFSRFQKQFYSFDEDPVIVNFFGDVVASKGIILEEGILYDMSKAAKLDLVKSPPSSLSKSRLSTEIPLSMNQVLGKERTKSLSLNDSMDSISSSENFDSDSEDESGKFSTDIDDESSMDSISISSSPSLASATTPTSTSASGNKSAPANSYHLPFWVKKREVVNIDGQRVLLEDIFNNSTTVFILLRQFGWKSANELAQVKPFFDLLGVKLVAIGNGTHAMARNFKEDRDFPGEIYVDESRQIYDDFQCIKGWKNALFNSKTMKSIKRAFKEGYMQGSTQGNMLQNGGTFIIKDFRVIYEHLEKFAGDHADVIGLLQVLGADQGLIDQVYLETPKLRRKKAKLEKKIDKYQKKLDSITEEMDYNNNTTPIPRAQSANLPRAASDGQVSSLNRKPRLRKSEKAKKIEETIKVKLQNYVKQRDNLETSTL